MAEELRRISGIRNPIRDNIELAYSKLLEIDTWDRKLCVKNKACIQNYLKRLENLDQEYLNKMPNSNDADSALYNTEVGRNMDYTDKGLVTVSLIDVRLDELSQASMTLVTNNSNNGANNNNIRTDKEKTKLQPLELPKFSGKETENFASLMSTLEEMLDGRGMGNVAKFIHLKQWLENDPLHAVSALENKDASWQLAKDILNEYFLDSDEKKFNLLNTFNELKFSYSESIFSFFCKVDNLIKEIESSNIDTKYFLQYFLWKSISSNQTLESIYTKVTEEAYPNYDQIVANRKKVMKLYNKQQTKYKESRAKSSKLSDKKQKVKSNQVAESTLAANVPDSKYSKEKSNATWCILCKGSTKKNDHLIYRCPNYITSKQKIARLNEQNACTKCGFTNHTAKNCTFIFHNRCRHCDGRHHSWLCNVNESAKSLVEDENDTEHDESESENESDSESECEGSKNERKDYEEVKINMCSTSLNNSCLPSNAVLPTFQGEIKGLQCRGLKDSGCQKNFISASLVKKAKLTPGQQVELTVSGFNSSKTHKTFEVNVFLEFGGEVFELDMIILPTVSTKFSADGISSLAMGFETKGYKLADPGLKFSRNLVEDLDIVLGISATHIFLEKVRTFGENGESYFLETKGGVIPVGHSLKSYSNLKYLPYADQNPIIDSVAKLSTYQTKQKQTDSVKLSKPKNENVKPKK